MSEHEQTPAPEETPAPDAPSAEDEAPGPEVSADGGAPAGEAGADAAPAPEPEAEAEPDYKDLYLRAAAETDNVRKRARRDIEIAQARGVARLARELLPALDNLDRAIASAEAQEADTLRSSPGGSGAGTGESHPLTKGIRLVQQELLGAMSRAGIEPYSPAGEVFDPHQHEAVAQHPVEGAVSGTIVEVFQPGYRYRDEVLRAAKVVVAA